MPVLWRAHLLATATSLLAIDILDKSTQDRVFGEFQEGHIDSGSASSAADLCAPAQFALERLRAQQHGIVRLLLPTVDGYVIQTDFLRRRLVDCDSVSHVEAFKAPQDAVRGVRIEDCTAGEIADICGYAIGALVVSSAGVEWPPNELATLDNDLENRLSFHWHSATPTPRRQLAVIRPGPFANSPLALDKLEDLASAAASLNISVVVFDDAKHGLGDDARWAHLRDVFVPTDMAVTPDLAARLAAAVRAYGQPFDGILALFEPLVPVVAEVAVMLGLPSHPMPAVEAARDKFLTRQHAPARFCERVQSVAELDAFLARYRGLAPRADLPLIVKPASGWASEGVSKVASEGDLRAAVLRLWQPPFTDKYGRDAQGPVLLEPYVSGPEVDVNVVLADGEVVFYEVNDDFPSGGDSDDQRGFIETATMMPSALPDAEQRAVCDKVHAVLLSMGFRSGIFNVEARVQNSTLEYAAVDGHDGTLLDLAPCAPPPADSRSGERPLPSVFVIEVNARAPGPRSCFPASAAYGVSYRSLSLLTAVADIDRLGALATPFRAGAQYPIETLYVSAQRGGVYRGGDICARVFEREPQLRAGVVKCMAFLRDGQDVPDPRTGRPTGLACFWLALRAGRRDVLALGARIQAAVTDLTGGF